MSITGARRKKGWGACGGHTRGVGCGVLGVHACGAVGLAGQRAAMGHTSDVLCGAGIVSRTGETGARVAAIIAAGENATGVTTGVAAGIAAAVATVVATEDTSPVATVVTP